MGCVFSECLLTQEQKEKRRERKRYFRQLKQRRSSSVVQAEVTMFRMMVMKEQADILRSMSLSTANSNEELVPQDSCIDRRKRWREWRPRMMLYIGREKEEN